MIDAWLTASITVNQTSNEASLDPEILRLNKMLAAAGFGALAEMAAQRRLSRLRAAAFAV